MPTANFVSWAEHPERERIVAAILQPRKISDDSTASVYLATSGGVWDGSHYFEPSLQGCPRITHKAQNQSHGSSLITFGEMVIAIEKNAEITPSGLTCDDLLSGGYACAGHPVTVYVGGPDLAWADWAVIASGYMGHPEWTDTQVSLPLLTNAEVLLAKQTPILEYLADASNFTAWAAATAYSLGDLRRPAVANNYFYECTTAGTSGASAPAWPTTAGNTVNDNGIIWTCRALPTETVGRACPLVYGEVKSLTPVLIDSASHLYQWSCDAWGPYQALDATYVEGVAVAAPTSRLNAGTIRFAADPAGAVTVDVKGRKVSGTYIYKPGDIASDILQTFAGVASADLVSADFTQLNTDAPYTMGLALTGKTEIKNALDSLFAGLLVVWGTTREGKWFVREFQAASGTPDVELTDLDTLTFKAGLVDGPIWKVAIKADRNQTTMTNPATGATEARREWLKSDYRERSASDDSILDDWPLASEAGPHETCLASLTDAATVAAAWLSLYGAARRSVRVQAPLPLLAAELLDVVCVTRDRWGFAAGLDGRVTEIVESYGSNGFSVEMELFI